MLRNTGLNYYLFGCIHVNTLTFYNFIHLFNYIFSRKLKLNPYPANVENRVSS